MAVYGKKKKSTYSSFAAVQDDKAQQNSNQGESIYSRLGNVKAALSRTRSRAKVGEDDGDVDEGGVEHASSLYNYTATVIRPNSSKSTKDMTEDLGEPLPQIPHKSSSRGLLAPSRPALGDKSANTKMSSKARVTKADISSPVRNETMSNVTETLSRPATSGTTAHSISAPSITIDDADELQRQISSLVMQAAVQEENSERKAKLYAAHSGKISPFQRGRKAFSKATRAIKDRLSSHSDETPRTPAGHSSKNVDLHPRGHPSFDNEIEEVDTRTRLNRRIAEGQNLANPKIQSLVGDGNVARKPLPVYESMKSRSQRSGSFDDPFSEGDEVKPPLSSHLAAEINVDFNKPMLGKLPDVDQAVVSDEAGSIPLTSEQHVVVPQDIPRYSNKLSGLAQHPDVMEFSSSPVAFSTPRVRLEPALANGSRVKVGDNFSRNPSVLEFNFEGASDDGRSSTSSNKSKSAADGSQSAKRKSSHSDIWYPAFPANKKSKRFLQSSNEGLTASLDSTETDDDRVPLSSKDMNNILGPVGQSTSKGRGLKLLQLTKGRSPEAKGDQLGMKARPRPINDRRSSLPRSGITLLNGRDPRPGLKRLTSIDIDRMDIDELQMSSAEYQIGGKKNG